MKPFVLYLRVTGTLKDQLREAAKQNGRTLNAEAVQRLKGTFEGYRKF